MIPEGFVPPQVSPANLIRRREGFLAIAAASFNAGEAAHALECYAMAFDDGADPTLYSRQAFAALEKVIQTNAAIRPEMVVKVCRRYPNDNQFTQNEAFILSREGRIIQSVCSYTNLLNHCPENRRVEVMNDLENMRTHFFDQWHWMMINDRRRNQAFSDGIRQVLEMFRGLKICVNTLDLGCGSGILTVMADKHAKELGLTASFNAVDSSHTFGSMAHVVCADNQVKATIKSQHSKEFKVPGPVYMNLVISETLDCAIFGERICSSLIDIYNRMRAPTHFHSVPQSAKLFVQVIYSKAIKEEHYRDMGTYCLMSQETYRMYPHHLPAPYDCDHMDKAGYTALSESVEVLGINFEDINDLKRIVSNKAAGDFKVTLTQEGEVTAVMAFFMLVTGVEACLLTEPGHKSCWPQAIFPIRCHQVVPAGTVVDFKYEIHDEKLFIQPVNLPEPQKDVIRAPVGFDFRSLNNGELRQFIMNFVDSVEDEDYLVDVTDLAIESPKVVSHPKSEALQYYGFLNNSTFFSKSNVTREKAKFMITWPFCPVGGFNVAEYLQYEEKAVMYQQLLFPSRLRYSIQLFSSDELRGLCHLVPKERRNDTYCGVNLDSMETLNIRYYEEVRLNRISWIPCSDEAIIKELDMRNVTEVINKWTELASLTPYEEAPEIHGILFWIDVLSPSGDVFSFKQNADVVKAFVFGKSHKIQKNIEVTIHHFEGRLLFKVPELTEPDNVSFYEKFKDLPV